MCYTLIKTIFVKQISMSSGYLRYRITKTINLNPEEGLRIGHMLTEVQLKVMNNDWEVIIT